MSIAARTQYANVADGQLDKLWTPNGRQAASPDRIGAEKDPLGGNFRVQRHTLRDGDVVFGGERCETLTGDIGTPQGGGRTQCGTAFLLDKTFNTSSSGWNYLLQYHPPNDGTAQVNVAFAILNGNQLHCRVLGGPVNSDGTMGSVNHSAVLATVTKWEWHDFWLDVLFHDSHGAVNLWLDGKKVTPNSWQDIPTNCPGLPNSQYLKQGMYRSPGDSGTNTIWYKDMVGWNSRDADEMLAYYGSATPPPPPPVVTNAQLRDEAVAALKATTVTYQDWQGRVDKGRYTDVTQTKWWQAFDLLGKIK